MTAPERAMLRGRRLDQSSSRSVPSALCASGPTASDRFPKPMSLELRNVSKVVGSEVHIHPTSLVLTDEGFNILLGTTLAGKTTLMQLMAGIQRPSSGEVWF